MCALYYIAVKMKMPVHVCNEEWKLPELVLSVYVPACAGLWAAITGAMHLLPVHVQAKHEVTSTST